MSLFIASLNSGSNGNCYYVGNETEAILIDAGISCREIEKRMKRLSLSVKKLKAVFISHEHADHIYGVKVLSRKYRLPVYITKATLLYSRLRIEKDLILSFNPHESINIGDLCVTAFPKLHDAADPCSFIIACKDVKVGVFTDIGMPCEHVISYFKQCHAAFLETNYDEYMLETGDYPYVLKKRIGGSKGHLSNEQALEVFTRHRPSFMTHLFLSHLSKNNNCPKLVQELFDGYANGVKIIIASRFEETAVYHIKPAHNTDLAHRPRYVRATQLSFEFV